MIAQDLSLNLSASINQSDYLYNSEVIGLINGKKTESQKIVIPVYLFTESGSQLIRVIQSQANSQYFIDCLELIREKHKDFVITAHTINYISDEGEVNFNKVNILSSEFVSDE